MNKPLRKPGFGEGIVVALLSAIIASAGLHISSSFVSESNAIDLTISMMTILYIVYIANRSENSAGQITIPCITTLVVLSVWLVDTSTFTFLLTHLFVIWLVRSLYFSRSLFYALADLTLQVLAIGLMQWAATRTDSIFIAAWTFFLVQACLPISSTQPFSGKQPTLKNHQDRGRNNKRFNRSARLAESALKTLFSQNKLSH